MSWLGGGKKVKKPSADVVSQLPTASDPIALNLGAHSLAYVPGTGWTSTNSDGDAEASGAAYDGYASDVLLEENEALRKENNLLSLKVQLLMDMLTVERLDKRALNNTVA